MAIPFRFETVLRVRQSERNQLQLALVQEQRREAALLSEQNRVATERLTVLDDLRAIHDSGNWIVDRALARQQHAEHLDKELIRIQAALKQVSTALVQCCSVLLQADISVKALEKLAGRHESDQVRMEQATAERDRDDSWRAAS